MKADFVYTGIRVRDLEQSIAFYTKILNMQVTGRQKIKEADGEVVSLQSKEGGPELELNFYEKGSKNEAPYTVGEGLDHLAFRVGNMDEAIREAEAAGHPLVLDVKTAKSRWVYIQDPDGIYIELLS